MTLYSKTKRPYYTLPNLIRKVCYRVYLKINYIFTLYRKCSFYFYTKCWPGRVGVSIKFVRISNGVCIGKGSSFFSNVILEIGEVAVLNIGKGFTLSYGCLLQCNNKITIGNNVIIGEYSSIRDTSHNSTDRNVSFREQPDFSVPITIGNNVWIGRGCIVLPGTTIEDNVIVGANSVVKGHLEGNSIYAGATAKKIKSL